MLITDPASRESILRDIGLAVVGAIGTVTSQRLQQVGQRLQALHSIHQFEGVFGNAWDYMDITLVELKSLVSRGRFVHALNLCRPMVEFAVRATWVFGYPNQPEGRKRYLAYYALRHAEMAQDSIKAFGPTAEAIEWRRTIAEALGDSAPEPMPRRLEDAMKEVFARPSWAPTPKVGAGLANMVDAGLLAQLHMSSHADPALLMVGWSTVRAWEVAAATLIAFHLLSHAAIPLLDLTSNPDDGLIRELWDLVPNYSVE